MQIESLPDEMLSLRSAASELNVPYASAWKLVAKGAWRPDGFTHASMLFRRSKLEQLRQAAQKTENTITL
jgi:hypothetical protein